MKLRQLRYSLRHSLRQKSASELKNYATTPLARVIYAHVHARPHALALAQISRRSYRSLSSYKGIQRSDKWVGRSFWRSEAYLA